MYRRCAALGAVLLASLFRYGTAEARPITLAEALAFAEQSPALGVAETTLDEARGTLEQAGTYRHNPAVAASAGRARAAGSTYYDFEVSVSHGIELGGKRGARRSAATAERDAAAERVTAVRAALRAEVRRAFHAALVAQARIQVTAAAETWAREFREAALERMRLGAATQTEVNVAVANLGRAVAARKTADRDLLLARQALGEALGVTGADLEPSGALPAFPEPPADEQRLVAAALAARRDLAAADRGRSAQRAEVALEDALAVPDPELSVSWVRSAVEDSHAVVVGLRVEVPLWNRNQGARRAARAALKRSTLEVDAFRTRVEREVRTTLHRYRAAAEAVAAFDQQVLAGLGENLALARETLAAGKLGLLEVNAVRRDLVESQLAYLDATAEAVEAQAALEGARGRSLEGTP